jgi:hypothetical protein
MVVVFEIKDDVGLSLFGTCSIKVTRLSGYGGVIIFFVYLVICVSTVFYIKMIPQDNEVIKEARDQL